MKIAVCGSSFAVDKDIAKKAFEIGKQLAKNNILLLTGAGNGYPYEAAKGAFSIGGKVLGISPAQNEEEHTKKYLFPKENFTEIEYTGLGIPARNFPLVKEADAIILISGQTGTLNEFTIAFHYKKVIGVLEESGGITSIIKKIAEICNKENEKENVVYSENPNELVRLVLEGLKKVTANTT
ncbi:LOG family protein [Candidatus Woesearchaeota archaeon]|nr:LOG family protein [Candidatus Woesearchaeota archaeon]